MNRFQDFRASDLLFVTPFLFPSLFFVVAEDFIIYTGIFNSTHEDVVPEHFILVNLTMRAKTSSECFSL